MRSVVCKVEYRKRRQQIVRIKIIQWKSFLRFEGKAQIVGGVLELAAD